MQDERREEPLRRSEYRLLGGVHPAVLAAWAALIATVHLFPAIPIIGTGSTFSVSAALIPLAGVFFGPIGGGICAAVGNFIGQIIAPHIAWLGIGTFLVGTVNAVVAGLVSRRKWHIATGVIITGYILWFLTPTGRQAAIFPLIFYTLGLVSVAAGTIIWSRKHLLKDKPVLGGFGIFLSSYAGFVSAAGLANFFGILLYNWPPAMWKGLAFVSPWERAIFSLGASVIGMPLLIALPRIGVYLGADLEPEDEEEGIGDKQQKEKDT